MPVLPIIFRLYICFFVLIFVLAMHLMLSVGEWRFVDIAVSLFFIMSS